jgi:hypothetical protein
MELSVFLKQHKEVVKALNDQADAADNAAASHKRYAAAADAAADAAERLAASGGGPGAGGGGGGGGGGASAGGGRGGGRSPRPAPSFMQRMSSLAYSTRINMGGASPLLGRALSAVGLGAAAGPIGMGMAVMGAVQSLEAFSRRMDQAAISIIRFTEYAHTAGSTAGSLRSMGIDAGESNALRNRIASDPYAMGAAGRLGITVVPGPYGTMNSGDVALKAIEQIRGIKDKAEQERLIYMLGLERQTYLTHVSDGTFNRLKREGGALGATSASRSHQMAESEAATERLSTAFDRLKNMTWPLTEEFTRMKNGLSDVLTWINDKVGPRNIEGARKMKPWSGPAFGIMPGDIVANAAAAAGARAADPAKALDENTKSQERLTVALGRLTQRMEALGGGERARSAVPGNMSRGDQMWKAVEMGAFPTHGL